MPETFTTYQRLMWHFFAYWGVFRHYVDVTPKGQYKIRRHVIGNLLWWPLWANNMLKFVFYLLTYHGLLGVQVHFLDQMSLVDGWLMVGHEVIEGLIWSFKYPLWENLYRQWELQEQIYIKLGRPQHVADRITKTDKLNFRLYSSICTFGTVAMMTQYFEDPKYVLNTYAVLTSDTLFLRLLFGFHEFCFMFHGYIYQAFTMVCAQSFACSYQHIIEEMNGALADIIDATRTAQKQEKRLKANAGMQSESTAQKNVKASLQPAQGGEGENTGDGNKEAVANLVIPNRLLEIRAKGTQYNIRELIMDYKKITISARQHNSWVGAIMGFAEMVNYMQFVADVFMMFQLMKEEETDYLGIGFYIMDCIFGMIMLFRMLIILSRLYPQSAAFIEGLEEYCCLNTSLTKELRKTIKSLRIVSAKLSGCTMTPESVPTGVDLLFNYYICAAMWERPDQSSGRRT